MGANAGSYAQVAGVAGKGYAAYEGSQATKAALQTQSAVAAQNAQIGEWQAIDALDRGARAEQAVRQRGAQLKSTQTTRFAANGLSMDSGSVQDVLASTDYVTATDASTTAHNAQQEAWAYRVGASNASNKAALLAGRASSTSSGAAALAEVLGDKTAGTLLTKGGAVASQWYRGDVGGGKAAGGDGTWSI